MTDIPLPEPAMWYARGNVFSLKAIMQQGWHLEATVLFDADQMRAYAAACVAAERERCARLCESAPERYDITGGAAEVARALAKEIRSDA